MKQNLLKFALCAMAMLPLGAWAADVTQINSYTLWTFANYSGQTTKVYNYTDGGTDGTGIFLHSTQTESEGSYTYVDFGTNSGRASATSGTFTNGLEWSASKILTCRRGVTTGDGYFDGLGNIGPSNDTSGANASLAFKTTVPGKLYVIYGNTSITAGKFYIKFNAGGSGIKFANLIDPVNMDARTDEDGYKYTLQESVATVSSAGTIYMGADVAYCIYAVMFIPTATYDETTANTISNGTYEITINRTLTANTWNSIVLPFAFKNDKMEEFAGKGAKLAGYTSISGTAESVELVFTVQDITSTATTAGRPYLIKPTVNCTSITYAGTVSKSAANQTRSIDDVKYTFTGLYSPTLLETTDFYFASGNKIKSGNGTNNLNAFRSYIKTSAVVTTRSMTFGIDDNGQTTYLDAIEGLEEETNTPIYNLQGQKVAESAENLPAGIYIKKGKKFVVK